MPPIDWSNLLAFLGVVSLVVGVFVKWLDTRQSNRHLRFTKRLLSTLVKMEIRIFNKGDEIWACRETTSLEIADIKRRLTTGGI